MNGMGAGYVAAAPCASVSGFALLTADGVPSWARGAVLVMASCMVSPMVLPAVLGRSD